MDIDRKKRLYKRLRAELDADVKAIRDLGKYEVELLKLIDNIDGDIWLYKSYIVMSCVLPVYTSSMIPKK